MQVGNDKGRFSMEKLTTKLEQVCELGGNREGERKRISKTGQPWFRVEQSHFLQELNTLVSI